MDFIQLLQESVNQKASDVFIRANMPPAVRIHGKVVPSKLPSMTADETRALATDLMTREQLARFERRHEIDLAFTMEGVARFRVNIYQERGSIGIVLRVVPLGISRLESLGLPSALSNLVTYREGLVLVTGPTGSGKSTTLAAMIDIINDTRRCNIMTIEDPIEFVHQDKKAIINQREVGVDTASFTDALKYVVRQSADVILIGEMRDVETMSVALQASGTGHLVLSTVHTAGAAESIERIVNMFPPHDKDQICFRLAGALRGVVSQKLVPKADGTGRVPAVEVMINTPTVSKMLEEGHLGKLYGVISEGAFWGMQTLNQSLLHYLQENTITEEDALSVSNNQMELRQMIRR